MFSGKVMDSTKELRLNNKLDENTFTVTMAWNDVTESELNCTQKDLNLELVDGNNKVLHSSELIQNGQGPVAGDSADRRSCYARESFSVKGLERGIYKLRVTAKSSNFAERDSFKVIITDDRPESLEFLDKTTGFEIMPPADNESVVTIGDKSLLSSIGPTADGRIKPDFIIENSKVSFSNGNLTQGSSNAAAMFAGSIAVLKSHNEALSTTGLLDYASSLRVNYVLPMGLIESTMIPQWIQKYIPANGLLRIHPVTGRGMIFSIEDPLQLPFIRPFNLRRLRADDIIACNEFLTFCQVYPRSQDSYIRPPLIEFRTMVKEGNGSAPGIWNNIQAVLSKI